MSSYQLLWTSSAVLVPVLSSAAGCYFPFCAVLHNSATFGLVSSGNRAVRPCMETMSEWLSEPSWVSCASSETVPHVPRRVLCPDCEHMHSCTAKALPAELQSPAAWAALKPSCSFLCWLCNFSRVVVLEMKDIAGLLCLMSLPVSLKLKSHKIHTDEFSL